MKYLKLGYYKIWVRYGEMHYIGKDPTKQQSIENVTELLKDPYLFSELGINLETDFIELSKDDQLGLIFTKNKRWIPVWKVLNLVDVVMEVDVMIEKGKDEDKGMIEIVNSKNTEEELIEKLEKEEDEEIRRKYKQIANRFSFFVNELINEGFTREEAISIASDFSSSNIYYNTGSRKNHVI